MIGLTEIDLQHLVSAAQASPRKRSHRSLHLSLDAPVQRLAIAMEPETYVRPHRHPQTWEIYVALRGAFKVILFDENATVTDCLILGPELKVYELPQNTWHSVVSLEPGSVIFEIKEGPYIQPRDADVASWSPLENDSGVAAFYTALREAKPGECYLSGGK